MLSRYSNEVLSRGPGAILPQNLSTFWLESLQKCADDFLDSNFAADHCTAAVDMGDPLLVASVHEALGYTHGPNADLPSEALAEHVTIYALSITMETIRRESDMEMTLPTLDNLLSIDRIIQFGSVNPDFGQFLARACITPEPTTAGGRNWFQQLKQKIRGQLG